MTRTTIQRALGFYGKVLRLTTFSLFVGMVLVTILGRSVYGSTAMSVYELDRELARRAGSLDQQSYRVHLNGQSLGVSSHMTDASVHEVLDAADGECRAHTGGLDTAVSKLPGVAMAKLTSAVFGVVHREWADGGFVACIERDEGRGLRDLAADLSQVAETGDLGRLGTLHYVMVDRERGATKTHVLRQWTDGSFDLTHMFPAHGDAPGTDLAEVPRPDGARRVLDASVEGTPFGVRVYDSPGTPAGILARYEQDLALRGWTNVKLPEKDAANTRVFDLGPSDVFVTATPQGPRTIVSIADMPPPTTGR